jgi:twitching motility two-component system response regulator PilH
MKVLIVDDEDDVLTMYKEVLEKDGFEVETANNGQKGLDLAFKQPPDVILLDIIMPKFNGLDVLQMLKSRSETKELPVYLLTNLPEEASGEKGKQLGAAGYLVKANNNPSTVATLLKGIAQAKERE